MDSKKVHELCYTLYRVRWLQNITMEEKMASVQKFFQENDNPHIGYEIWILQHGYDGRIYKTIDEFLETHYKDGEYMKDLITDEELWEALENEISRAISAETELNAKIDAEIERAQEAEQILDEKISAETAARIEADERLEEMIEDEIERATQREDEIEEELFEEIDRAKAREDEIDGQLIDASKNPYTLSASVGKDEFNMVLESKDGNEEHFIKIQFDGNFGEI